MMTAVVTPMGAMPGPGESPCQVPTAHWADWASTDWAWGSAWERVSRAWLLPRGKSCGKGEPL